MGLRLCLCGYGRRSLEVWLWAYRLWSFLALLVVYERRPCVGRALTFFAAGPSQTKRMTGMNHTKPHQEPHPLHQAIRLTHACMPHSPAT
jgi:hypothetical protein